MAGPLGTGIVGDRDDRPVAGPSFSGPSAVPNSPLSRTARASSSMPSTRHSRNGTCRRSYTSITAFASGSTRNYARDLYQRYVNTNRQGGPFYDLYGNYQTWGWLIFDWNQTQPGQFGSSIYKDPRFNGWFNAVTVSSDSRDQYYLAITIGERIRTALTPLTFSKPRFNGIQMDFAANKYEATLLFSRASEAILGTTPRAPAQRLDQRDQYDGRAGDGAGGGFCQGRCNYGQCPPLADASRGVLNATRSSVPWGQGKAAIRFGSSLWC